MAGCRRWVLRISFGLPIVKLPYTVVAAMVLTVFFDLCRIAALGAIFCIIMDIAVHWRILRHRGREVGASAAILLAAIILDVVDLGALIAVNADRDMTLIYVSLIGLVVIFLRSSCGVGGTRKHDR